MEFGPGVSELSSLKSAEDSALLANTQERYDAGHIYTRSGRLLLAVNPYRKLPIYTDSILNQYKSSLQPQVELPPHVYAVASSAHLGMMQNSKSQSVIISGESGAGKTETAKILLKYLAEVACPGSDLHDRVLQTNPIMENFGCAKTVWNNNSSRFGKFLTLQFNVSGRMQGAFMKTYLLEKSRIVNQLSGEQNYHVLYQVAKGMYGAHKGDWSMVDPEAWVYLNAKGSGGIMWNDLPSTFDELKEAFATIPALQPVAEKCWRVLVAVLHLGNLTLAAKGDEDAAFTKETTKHVAACAKLLGVPASPQGGTPEEVLSKAILSQNIKAGLDWIAKPNTSDYAQSVKDALSKAVRAHTRRLERRRRGRPHGRPPSTALPTLLLTPPAPPPSLCAGVLEDVRFRLRGDQLFADVRRRLALLHRRRRHLRIRVLPDQLARAALHQLRQREAAAHVHGGRLRVGHRRVTPQTGVERARRRAAPLPPPLPPPLAHPIWTGCAPPGTSARGSTSAG